jgi:hypothetical protein
VKTKTCPDCNGDGVIEKGTNDEQQCPTRGGSGFVPDDDDDDDEVTRTANWRFSPAKDVASYNAPVFWPSADPDNYSFFAAT